MCPPPGTDPMPYWAVPPYGSCSDATAFTLTSVEPSDAANFVAIGAMKAAHPKLKLVVSIGGWNYPSAYFSAMAATNASRATFIASVVAYMASSGADGADIDWEYPCSPPRSDPVEITCTDFQYVLDRGGDCPSDTINIVSLLLELRAALGPTRLLTVASQAAKALEHEVRASGAAQRGAPCVRSTVLSTARRAHASSPPLPRPQMAISKLAPYVDEIHSMTYDYAVSDVAGAGPMSPNAPLYTPSAPGTVQMSIK